MDEKTENEIISILDEQVELRNIEAFAGNTVKREFHEGAIFGIKLILETVYAQSADTQPCRFCGGANEMNFNFCGMCGRDIKAKDVQKEAKEKKHYKEKNTVLNG